MRGLTNPLIFLAAIASHSFPGIALAGAEDDALFELQVTGHAGQGARRSLLATQLYAEKALPGRDVSVFLVANRDQEFRSVYAGLARQFGDFQLGIGFGNAWYDSRRHPTLNPWLFYRRDDFEAFASAERYSREDRAPWFYKGYVRGRIAGSVFAGAYGEKDFGVGPMIGRGNGGFKIWSAVPVASRPKLGWLSGCRWNSERLGGRGGARSHVRFRLASMA